MAFLSELTKGFPYLEPERVGRLNRRGYLRNEDLYDLPAVTTKGRIALLIRNLLKP